VSGGACYASVVRLATLALAAAALTGGPAGCAQAQPDGDAAPEAGAADAAPFDASADAAPADAGPPATDAGDTGGPPAGPELAVAENLAGAQARPRVAAAGDGSFAVVWEGSDGLGRGVRARCFDASGAPTGGEIAVNTSALGDQLEPAVAVSGSSGTVLVAWTDAGGATDDVRYKVLATPAAGCGAVSATDLLLASTLVGDQARPHLVARAGGGFAAVWRDTSAAAPAVRARLFDDLGGAIGGDFMASATAPGEIERPAALDLPGAVLFLWEWPDAAGAGIVSRAFAGAAMPTTGETAVNTGTAGDQLRPGGAASALGAGIAIVWATDPLAGGGAPDLTGVFVRRYSTALAPLDAADVEVDTGVDGTCTEGGAAALDGCARAAVAASGTGAWLAVWPAVRAGAADASGSGIRGRRFDTASFLDPADFPVNTSTSGDQLHPDVAGRADGSFVVVWAGGSGAPVDLDVRARLLGP
jgi:hypothetical protein